MTIQDDIKALSKRIDSDVTAWQAGLAAIYDEAAPPAPVITPAPASLAATLGVYPGFDGVAALNAFESQLGKPMKFIVQMGDTRSADAFESSVWGETTDPKSNLAQFASRATLVLSVPIAFGVTDVASVARQLAATNSGANDGAYQRAFGYVKAAGFKNVIIRLAWEADGKPGWMSDAAVGNEPAFKQGFGHVAFIVRSVLPGALIDYCGTLGYDAEYQAAYPGDNLVDICGLDVYDAGRSVGDMLVMLRSHGAFAKAHGKKVSYPEWGLNSDRPEVVSLMVNQFVTDGVTLAYESYFNEDTNGAIRLSELPNSLARYKALLG